VSRRAEVALLNRLLNDTLTRLATHGGVIRVEITPASSNGQPKRPTGICAWPGCTKRVTGERCRPHAQMVRAQEQRLHPGRFREPHQRAALRPGGYNACECGRPKPATEKECDVCRELNKHRQAPGR
jgi:hypothetical protein